MAKTNRIISSISYPFSQIAKFFKKMKFDNFIGGLIVGALFSLIVNVLTVQIQESVTRQRALEAVEREVAQHVIDSGNFYGQGQLFLDMVIDGETLYYPEFFYLRLNTNIWESGEAYKYIFELDPAISESLSTYYETSVKVTNNSLERIQEEFEETFNIYCRPSNVLRDSNFKADKRFCNDLILETFEIYNSVYNDVWESTQNLLNDFHPTQDRLNSFWLKLILGGNSSDTLEAARVQQASGI
ncbi:MAG: hypothetical protein R3313_00815 [Candidatus Saccharimonadales bacterium]|nr:hypothetical protein [Candidatus Saccharimonadales bacterium]